MTDTPTECIEPGCTTPALRGRRCQPHHVEKKIADGAWRPQPTSRDRAVWENVRAAVLERDGDVCACGRAALSAIYSRPYQPSLRLDVSALVATCPRCWPRRMPTDSVGVIGSRRESAK